MYISKHFLLSLYATVSVAYHCQLEKNGEQSASILGFSSTLTCRVSITLVILLVTIKTRTIVLLV